MSTWGAEDERWAWEDDLLADVVVERRAVQRPFDRPDDLDALLRGAGFDDVVVHTEQHEVHLADADEWWAWKWSYSLRGMLEQLPQPRLERLRAEADGAHRGDERRRWPPPAPGGPHRRGAMALIIPSKEPLPRAARCRSGGGRDPFQGMVECWFGDQETYEAAMASPEWAELEADGDVGFEMTKLYGGFVREHVMRWDGLSDGRIYTTAGDIPAS